MNNTKIEYGRSVTALDLLAIAFIVLKLTNVIHWSWIAVLAPIWVPLLLVLSVIFLQILLFAIESK